MNAKTYRVSSMQEAMRLIREELGPDASVLHTRQIEQAWWRRLMGGPSIEVVAAADVEVPSRLTGQPKAAQPVANGLRAVRAPRENMAQPSEDKAHDISPTQAKTPLAAESSRGGANGSQRAGIATAPRRSTASPKPEARVVKPTPRGSREGRSSLRRLRELMRSAELPGEAAREYVERLRPVVESGEKNLKRLKAKLIDLLEADFHATGPIRVTPGKRRVVALVGPTGVGKTTTIAKLAANYQLRQRCRVGLVTADTFRIAAADQLRTYADIIGVPLEVVSTPAEMARALGRMADRDLVFLDTSGHGPRDEVRVGELKAMLAHARPDETHLVLSATASGASCQSAATLFAEVRATALLVTKLDEARSLGALWPLLRRWRWPVSYFTGGQNVPDDIEPASAATLARRMLGHVGGAAHV